MLEYIIPEKIWLEGILFSAGESISIAIYTMCMIAVVVCAYLLGSVNTAVIVSRLVYKEDIRTKGSGNAGMTNMMRNYGIGPAAVTLAGDMLKTLLGMLTGTLFIGINGAYIAGLFCVIGHVIPIFYRFKGGKGVAATVMMILYLDIKVFLISVLIFVLIVWATKYLSLGSVMLALIYPLLLYRNDIVVQDRPIRLIASLIVAAIVVYQHRANIKRIMDKTESKFSFKKTVKQSEEPVVEEDGELDEDGFETEQESEEVRLRKEMNRRKSAKKKKK